MIDYYKFTVSLIIWYIVSENCNFYHIGNNYELFILSDTCLFPYVS